MVQNNTFIIPDEFRNPLFFNNDLNSFILNFDKEPRELLLESPFAYDMAYNIAQIDKPWLKLDVYIPVIFKLWEEKHELLHALFEKRERQKAKEPMILSIALFLQLLFWANEMRVPSLKKWKDSVITLAHKPININERLEFIIDKPNHYHSFVQLSELFNELKKQYYKIQLLKK